MVRQVVNRIIQIILMLAIAAGLGGCCLHQTSHAEKTYCVIDLTRTSNDGTYSMSWLDDIPKGGWSLEHKTRKLVLRRIPPGRFKFLGKYDVEITRPFYIGVFEFTCAQYELLTGKSVESLGVTRLTEDQPLWDMEWEEVCGEDADLILREVPPVGVDGFAIPKKNSLMGMLSQKTGRRFSLPTEAQWEYACRAGVDTAFNIGNAGRDDWETMRLCGCSRFDPNLRFKNFKPIIHVGAYRPNRWGLYDMHGNLEEMCLDEFVPVEYLSAVLDRGVADPCFNGGPNPNGRGAYVTKGGSLRSEPSECTTTSREERIIDGPEWFVGFRVVMEACD